MRIGKNGFTTQGKSMGRANTMPRSSLQPPHRDQRRPLAIGGTEKQIIGAQ
jgi:hypothetical protein